MIYKEPLKETINTIKEYLLALQKHLTPQTSKGIPNILKELDKVTNINELKNYKGLLENEVKKFIPYYEAKENLANMLKTPTLKREPKEVRSNNN